MTTLSARANSRRTKSTNGRNRREAARLGCGGLYQGLSGTPTLVVSDGTSREEVDGAFQRGDAIAGLVGSAHNPSVLVRILSK